MVDAQTVVSTGSGMTLKYLKVTSYFLLFVLLFSSAIISSIQQRSIYPLAIDIGGKIFLSTQHLATQCQKILDTGLYHFDDTKGKLVNMFNVLQFYSDIIVSIWIILMWIKVFAKFYGNTPFSFRENTFTNYSMGLVIYLLFQSFFVLIVAAAFHKISSIGDALNFAAVPIKSLILIFKALTVIFVPISDKVSSYVNTDINQTLLENIVQ